MAVVDADVGGRLAERHVGLFELEKAIVYWRKLDRVTRANDELLGPPITEVEE